MVGPGFNLPPETTFRILMQEYNPRCLPPWSEKEIRHKVESAYEKEKRRGYLLDQPAATSTAPGPTPTVRTALPGPTPVAREAAHRVEVPTAPTPAVQPGPVSYASLPDADLGIVDLERVEAKPVDWLWPYRLARGEMALVAGEGGVGKSQLLLSIAATISIGGEWPDGSGRAPVGRTVILAAEDDPATTIKPRLAAIGADLSKITVVKASYTIRTPGKEPLVSPVSLQDVAYWNAVFDRLPDARLLIIDPLPSYLGRGVNDSKNNELRAVVEPFVERVVRPRGICLLANTHLNKGGDSKSPIHRVIGSVAYAALARNVHFVVKDPDDPARRVFQQGKCNNAPDDLAAIGFRIEKRTISSAAGEIEAAVPVFEAEAVRVDLAEAMAGEKGGGKRGPAPMNVGKLAVFLVEYLRGKGPVFLAEIGDAAGEAGHLGVLKSDGRYSNFTALYRAAKLVPALPAPHEGWTVATSKDEPDLLSASGKARWLLRSVASPY
jgi:hypothetical protein